MLILLGLMTASGGAFLFLWYRTVVCLPLKRQPFFVRTILFQRCAPALSLAVFGAGLTLIGSENLPAAGTTAALCLLAGYLILRFDRYSATMRIICSRYTELRERNPELEQMELLFHLARWRYPQWSHDRLVELVAGKDFENLLLLMIVQENEVNPLQDWELFRQLKSKVARIVQPLK